MRINSKWEVKKLGEVCIVIAGQSPEGNYYNNNGKGLPFYQGKKEFTDKYVGYPTVWTTKITKKAQKGDILISVRAPVGPINFATEKICIGRGLAAIRPISENGFSNDYLFLFLMSIQGEIKGSVGAVFASINKNQIENILVPVPPINDQKKIVAKLDKFSENIKRLEDAARKNLQSAKDLFNSVLNETFKNKSAVANDNRQVYKKAHWEVKKLGQILTLEYGKPLPDNKRFIDGKHPVYGANGEKSKTNDFLYDKPSIIIGRKGSAGEINLTENKFWPLDVTYFVTFNNNQYYLSFLFWLLRLLNLPKLAKGVRPGINRNEVYNVDVCIPDIREQKKIAKKLDKLFAKTKKLEIVYQKKIDALAELKKSVLKQTFDCG